VVHASGQVDSALTVALLGVARRLRTALVAGGEEIQTVMLLRHVRAREPLRLSTLAGCAGLDASTVSRHVKHLEESGFVERAEDPDDKRASRLVTTARGRAVLDRAIEASANLIGKAVAEWPEQDRVALTDLVTRLAGALVREQGEAHGDPRTHS
jgi:DNA-binding MarR family transcriptional regulator